MSWNNNHFARSLRQREAVSKMRGHHIDYPDTGKKEGQLGIKQRIIMCYKGMGRDEARKLFNDLNKIGYPESRFEEWIAEFDFQDAVQREYREKGEKSAKELFDRLNKTEFDGKFKNGTFSNWINEGYRMYGGEGR